MNIWQRKLLAFLHDPPSKPFNVAEHRQIAAKLIKQAGFEDLQLAAAFFDKVCDHTAAAADRVVCPKSSAMHAEWHRHEAFKHPLGGGTLSFEEMITASQAESIVEEWQPQANEFNLSKVADRQLGENEIRPGPDWARFFLHWRLWPARCAKRAPSLVHLPADTRIPDHTTWTHCSLVSALQTCVEVVEEGEKIEWREFKPAFLLVHIGPVQEFIAQARTTRDCWSGSYLLSWLIAHGIKAVTDRIGPDCMLFPALRGQPLFDFLHKAELYEPLALWEEQTAEGNPRKLHADEQILTPNLPNRFLTVVPAGRAEELANVACEAMQAELRDGISKACTEWLSQNGSPLNEDIQRRWKQQVEQFLSVHWQAWPWEKDVSKSIVDFKSIPAGRFAAEESEDPHHGKIAPGDALDLAREAATKGIPFAHLDPRNYKHRSRKEGEVRKSVCEDESGNVLEDDGTPIIENPGFAWAAHYAMVDFLLAARRNTRDFDRWAVGDANRLGQDKDMLSGKEEAIGDKAWRQKLSDKLLWLFRPDEQLGAMNLIKRVWHAAYLEAKPRGLKRVPRFDSVPAIAAAAWRNKLVEQTEAKGPLRDQLVDLDGFGPLASAARKRFGSEIACWDECSDRDWLERTDASAFHLVEWDRSIRDVKSSGQRDELTGARRALARLQESPNKGGLGQPLCYVAILAMDGDSMGQWVSGAKSPLLKGQLAAEAENYFQKHDLLRRLLEAPRHVSPSYHLQFSEALATFSVHVAGPIVEFFHGQLIFSGGDDVLAMLPAANALPCARALRMAFRGDPDLWRCFDSTANFSLESSRSPFLPGEHGQDGFIALNGEAPLWRRLRLRGFLPCGYTLLVPGRNADVSAGIAIGHMHTPLQNLIEAARDAEKRAKQAEKKGGYGKAAFAVSLFKRSGEVQQWGAKWQQPDGSLVTLELADEFARLSAAEDKKLATLSNRFPYTLSRLLTPYTRGLTSTEFRLKPVNGFDPFEVFPREVEHALRQHGPDGWMKGDGRTFFGLIQKHLEACRHRRLDDFLGPFLTTAFLNRNED